MDGQGVQAIVAVARESALTKPFVAEGEGYRRVLTPTVTDGVVTWRSEDLPMAVPIPAPITLHTLSGLADYVKANRDQLGLNEVMAHVLNHDRVELISRLHGGIPKRFPFVVGVCGSLFAPTPQLDSYSFQFGKWLDVEPFNIGLQALFVDTPERARILEVCGNVRGEGVTTWEDDGVSQAVTAGTGVRLGKLTAVPNPVELRPWRTFREIEQPSSKFVLRARGSANTMPQFALFEADGGQWKLTAIHSIAAWLRGALGDSVAVIA